MGILTLLITIVILLLAFRYYAAGKITQVVNPNMSRSTPARRNMDGVEFIPTPKSILAGYQFKSISLDLIIGPVIAVQFGWLPAVLWVLFGALFFGWAQDFLSTIISMREAGRNLSDLVGSYFNPGARTALLIFIFLYLLIIIGQFGLLIATLMARENVPINILLLGITAFLAGQMIYRWRIHPVWVVSISLTLVFIGFRISLIPSVDQLIAALNQELLGLGSLSHQVAGISSGHTWLSFFWIVIILLICALGAVLPIWRFSVPFNALSSWIILSIISLSIIGLIVGTVNGSISKNFEIPAITSSLPPHLGPIWPMLFVTISSGAVSGWHSLVTTFSSSHQVEKEPDAFPIVAGGLFLETIMVVFVIILAASFGITAGTFDPGQDYALIAGPASVFAAGLAETLNVLGFKESFVDSLGTILFAIMGITVLQLAFRYARIVTAALLGKKIQSLKKVKISTLFILVVATLIIFSSFTQQLWILFASANQLLAAITLLLASNWLATNGKSHLWTLLPAGFLFCTGLAALFYSVIYQSLFQQLFFTPEIKFLQILEKLVSGSSGILLGITACYLFFQGTRVLSKLSKERKLKS